MEGFDDGTYGDSFADVYDDWYADISDIDETVATLLELADPGAGADPVDVIELGVGTGRIAAPLARAGASRRCRVTGIDTSTAMLARLRDRDADQFITTVHGHMVRDLPAGPFAMAFVAYNTLFNLTADGEQAACFCAVAARLAPGGRFVVEAFVPDTAGRGRDDVSVRSLAADRVVLSVSVDRPDRQVAEGQFVEITESGGVRLRPWSIRYHDVPQLDAMAAAAGFVVERRWTGFDQRPFDLEGDRHVTVYRLA